MKSPRQPPVLGIVGGIGSGKSAVSKSLARRGGIVIDADVLGHQALAEPAILEQIRRRWPSVVGAEGADRKALGAVVFAKPAEREALEALVHPWICDRIREQLAAAKRRKVPVIVLDAVLLLEAGLRKECDFVAFVDVSREQRVARVASRGWSEAELNRREAAQMPLDEKRRQADFVIDNSGTLDDLERALDRLMDRIVPTEGVHHA